MTRIYAATESTDYGSITGYVIIHSNGRCVDAVERYHANTGECTFLFPPTEIPRSSAARHLRRSTARLFGWMPYQRIF